MAIRLSDPTRKEISSRALMHVSLFSGWYTFCDFAELAEELHVLKSDALQSGAGDTEHQHEQVTDHEDENTDQRAGEPAWTSPWNVIASAPYSATAQWGMWPRPKCHPPSSVTYTPKNSRLTVKAIPAFASNTAAIRVYDRTFTSTLRNSTTSMGSASAAKRDQRRRG